MPGKDIRSIRKQRSEINNDKYTSTNIINSLNKTQIKQEFFSRNGILHVCFYLRKIKFNNIEVIAMLEECERLFVD